MSAIAGIVHWDRQPVDDTKLAVMIPFLTPAGPHAASTVSPAPGVVMHTSLLHFDHLSRQERQPHLFGSGRAVAFDGRLDNRDDLLLTLHHELGDDVTDVALAAAAYSKWGENLPARLVGDWSLALWDGAQRRLLLACDYAGNRPLFYLALPNGLVWSSSLEAIAEAFELYGSPNVVYVAGKLAGHIPAGVTPYTNVHQLRAGHLLVASGPASIRVRSYWRLEPATIRYKHVQDYAEHARHLMQEGVRTRLRATGRVWAHLSGGWDSSSIVCLADRLIARRQVEADSLQPISIVIPSAPESDESHYIELVERWSGRKTLRLPYEAHAPSFQQLLSSPRPGFSAEGGLSSRMIAAGDRIILSGQMGDLVMLRGSTAAIALIEELQAGHIWQFLRLVFVRARHRRRPLPATLGHLLWLAYGPQSVQLARFERQGQRVRAKFFDVQTDDLAGTYGMTPEAFSHVPPRHTTPAVTDFPRPKRGYVTGVYLARDSGGLSSHDLVPEAWVTYPFAHLPLVTFMAGVPQLAFWDPTFDRAGMRRALENILPQEILTRRSKGLPNTAMLRAERTLRDDLLSSGMPAEPPQAWRIVRAGYVRQTALERAIEGLKAERAMATDFVRTYVALEAWLRRLETRGRDMNTRQLPAAIQGASGVGQEGVHARLSEASVHL